MVCNPLLVLRDTGVFGLEDLQLHQVFYILGVYQILGLGKVVELVRLLSGRLDAYLMG